MKIAYDEASDVLYVSFSQASPGSFRMIPNADGDLIKVHKNSGDVLGITVLDFMQRAKGNEKLDISGADGFLRANVEELLNASV